jgi:DNA-binding IscR family transcriptional regulator
MSEACRFAFGVHVLAVLGSHPDYWCNSVMLARTVNTNPVVIRRLLIELHEAGLVSTERGVKGGAKLRRNPAQIRLGDLFRLLEPAQLFGCHPNEPLRSCPVGARIEVVLREIRIKATRAAERELNRVTLADVLAEMHAPKQFKNKKIL